MTPVEGCQWIKLDESEVMKLYDASRVNSTVPSAMYLFNSEWRRRIELSMNSSDIFIESRIPNLQIF